MGAQTAYGKSRRVIHIAGDGGIKMTGSEYYTIARLGLPIISLIVNNTSLGMIRQLQKVMGWNKDRKWYEIQGILIRFILGGLDVLKKEI